tara:strand:+ start:173 stop:625 length:453 start_codon:yes stop_codon:yes gene_type:complete
MYESKEDNLAQQLFGVWNRLYGFALDLTLSTSDNDHITEWFPKHLDRWADQELRSLGEWIDLSPWKNQVLSAFGDLLTASQSSKPKQQEGRCLICGQLQRQGEFGKMGCLECAFPVTSALETLVLKSTMRFSPSQLRERFSRLKKRSFTE